MDYSITMDKKNKQIQLDDNNEETSLFHAVDNIDLFSKLLTNSKIDVNQKNENNETIFIYSCRKGKLDVVSKLILYPECDLLCIDNRGRTGLMYLVENGICRPLYLLQKSKQFAEIDFNYRNKNNETLLSILVKQYYEVWTRKNDAMKDERLKDLTMVYKALLDLGCDFNSTIDEEGNTIMNFFLMVDDLPSAFYLISNYKDIDISIKNKDGISASFLSLFITQKYQLFDLKHSLMNHKTFDHFYIDSNNNSLLIHSLVRGNKDYFIRLSCDIINSLKFLNQTNNKKENVVIIAVKLGRFNYISERIINKFDLDQQDELGNTALHYAIKLRDEYAINRLCFYHANKDLKNHQEKTPLDLLMDQENNEDYDNDRIINIIKNPLSPGKFIAEKNSNSSINPFRIKTTDEKVNKYVKNYQIEQYKKEYEDLFVRPYSPYASLLEKMTMKWNSLYIIQQDTIPRFKFKY